MGPRGQVQGPRGAPYFAPPASVCLLPSLLGLSLSKKNDPRKFAAHYDVVKALKQIRKEIGFFCLRRINSIDRGNHY